MNELDQLTFPIQILLRKANLPTQILSLRPCLRGGNNRTYRLETPVGVFAVKEYFRQPDDKRDRLAAESAFLSYANLSATSFVPHFYSQDEAAGLALYEFIEGAAITAESITKTDIQQAIDFFSSLNEMNHKIKAQQLLPASEACFSIQAHLDLIDTRIQNLKHIVPNETEDKMAAQLVESLQARWQALVSHIQETAKRKNISLTAILPIEQQCISPSDFGFHNALKKTDGKICFLDFEYAGWDDPAKMTGDFFSQLAVPVPAHYFDFFVNACLSHFSQADELIERAYLLRAIYQVKWCCIALNVFIPVNLARRQFAKPDLNVIDLKKAQLAKAEKIVIQLEVDHYG